MDAPDMPDPEEIRLIGHLNHVGYSLDGEVDPHGWRFAISPLAPLLCFRVVNGIIRLYARYPAGPYRQKANDDLLSDVNELNASQWLVRCRLHRPNAADANEMSVVLEAGIPIGLSMLELGACLFHWITEAARIESIVRTYAELSDTSASPDITA